MNRKGSKAPLLEPPKAAKNTQDLEISSPAHAALQTNLDNDPVLKKKSSWLNIGGNIRKGALAVKSAIDYVRGDTTTSTGVQ